MLFSGTKRNLSEGSPFLFKKQVYVLARGGRYDLHESEGGGLTDGIGVKIAFGFHDGIHQVLADRKSGRQTVRSASRYFFARISRWSFIMGMETRWTTRDEPDESILRRIKRLFASQVIGKLLGSPGPADRLCMVIPDFTIKKRGGAEFDGFGAVQIDGPGIVGGQQVW